MHRGAQQGESWADLHLNDTIISQSHAWGNEQERTDLLEWMREMCRWGNKPKVKMVAGEWVFQFTRLVVLEMWKEVKRERMQTNQLMDQLVEFKGMKGSMKEASGLIVDLQQRVCHLEEWAKKTKEERKGRRAAQFSLSLVQGLRFEKNPLKFRGGDSSEECPYVELGLLNKGVQFEELVASGSGLELGSRTLVMVMAPSSPLVSLEDLD